MKTAKKKMPSPKEIAEEQRKRWDDNREKLREARTLAVEVFGTSHPTLEMVLGVGQALDDVKPATLVPLFAEAIAVAKKYGSKSVSDELEMVDILLEDDEAVEHLEEAAKEARSYADASFETVVGIYYQIYGEDEE